MCRADVVVVVNQLLRTDVAAATLHKTPCVPILIDSLGSRAHINVSPAPNKVSPREVPAHGAITFFWFFLVVLTETKSQSRARSAG